MISVSDDVMMMMMIKGRAVSCFGISGLSLVLVAYYSGHRRHTHTESAPLRRWARSVRSFVVRSRRLILILAGRAGGAVNLVCVDFGFQEGKYIIIIFIYKGMSLASKSNAASPLTLSLSLSK